MSGDRRGKEDVSLLPWLLLPGLDGSGALFEEFLACGSPADVHVVRYPLDPAWRLDDYVAYAEGAARRVGPCVVIAESFSGCVALKLSRRCELVACVVWVASFFRCPNPLLKLTPLEAIGARLRRWATSSGLVRLMCLDFAISLVCVRAVQRAVRAIPIEVLRSRLRLLRELDEEAPNASDVRWLALAASRDRLVVPDSFPNGLAGTVMIIDGPHFLLQARPEPCRRAIENWLADLCR